MSKNAPHVLMVLNDIAWFWSHRQPLAQAILGRGSKLSLATAMASSDQGVKDMGVEGHDLPDHGKGLGLLFHVKIVRAIIKTIKETKPDIIHAITLRHAFYTGIATRLIKYRPTVFTVAGVGSLFTDHSLKMNIVRAIALPLLRYAFRGPNRFLIFQNPDDRNLMIKHGVVDENQTTIIRGSGVDLKEFPFTPEEQNEEPIVLFSSRLIREKGIDDFIGAARILKNKGVKARFQIAGSVYQKNPNSLSKEEMQGYHDEGVIEWLGQVSDMPSLFKEISIMALPSYYGEGVPKILLEAAAIGRPIITCDVPGCREAVNDNENGLLVSPKSPEELSEAIDKLLSDFDLRQSYGRAGRAMVEKDFHVESVVSRTLDVYDSMISKGTQ
ncbi:MAG: glycosyltransferase family 4 protein [Alphaproteobacteria bacterium]|nr:glycosyltransferase family 4 protein [Alphaproteobacteria bacterium]